MGDPRQIVEHRIVRPREHINNVRDAALKVVTDQSRADLHTMAWALGERTDAPFTGHTTTAGGPTPAEVTTELKAVDAVAVNRYGDLPEHPRRRAYDVQRILRWLVGQVDWPPMYGAPSGSAKAGDLVGGRGDIVRTPTQILAMLSAARRGLEEQVPIVYDGAAQGIIASLEFILGRRNTSPIKRTFHHELPDDGDLDHVAAQDVANANGPWAAEYSIGYGLGVMFTHSWLTGRTIKPPVDRTGEVRAQLND
ncbi:hypothetical protein GCM10027589_04640 [Actinocorallia lasiicapitis]